MSLAECPAWSSTGEPLCEDCGDIVRPWDPHSTCDVSVLKSLALALSQGASTMNCPRCGSESITGTILRPLSGPEATRTRCDRCDHLWGDGLPDSQERPLPDGFRDCGRCDGDGGNYGVSCSACRGEGIVRSALIR